MREKINHLRRSEFVKHSLTLFSGTVVSSLIPLFFSPIIARLFSPEQFGVYAIIAAMIAIFSNVASLRYETAVMLPKEDKDSAQLVSLSFLVAFFFSLLVFLLILMSYPFLEEIYHENGLASIVFIIPFAVWVVSFHKPINFWLSRFKKYRAIAFGKTFQGFSIAFFSVVFGLMSFEMGLVYGYVLGWLLFVLLMLFLSHKQTQIFSFPMFKKEGLKELSVEYKEFPRLNTFPTFLNDVAAQMSVLLITYFYTTEETGFFNFSRQYAFVPLSLIALSIGNVYFQRITAKKNEGVTIKKEFRNLLMVLSSIGFVAILVIELFGPVLFKMIFGDKWYFSGQLTQVLIFSFVVKFVVSTISSILPALREMKLASYFPIVYFVFMCSLFMFRNLAFEDFLIVLTLLDVFAYLFYFVLISLAVRRYERKLIN